LTVCRLLTPAGGTEAGERDFVVGRDCSLGWDLTFRLIAVCGEAIGSGDDASTLNVLGDGLRIDRIGAEEVDMVGLECNSVGVLRGGDGELCNFNDTDLSKRSLLSR
jgi:hypothetical protein